MLPPVASDAELDAFLEDEAAVSAVLAQLGLQLGLTEPLERPARGSAVVGLTRDDVVKVMAPMDAALSETEAACLQALDGRLPIATPSLRDAGVIDGWRWIRMSRLPGRELVEVWPELDAADRLSLAGQLGEALGVLHGLQAPARVQRLEWSAWVASRLDTLEATQRRKGCPEALLDGLADYVSGADLSPGPVGWLHTEVMLEHLLVMQTSQGWRLSGLFDLEPSWVAPRDYEFASVGLFVSAGDGAVLGEVLRAAGRDPGPRRLFAMAMVHRYANLGWYHRRLGGPTDLAQLANAWFG